MDDRTTAILARINAVLGGRVDVLPPISRMHELVARALVEPMTITPSEVQELARAVLLYFPMPDLHPDSASAAN